MIPGGAARRAAMVVSAAAAGLIVATACGTTTPLAREVDIGRDAYVVFVGQGPGRGSDLFAVPGRGGAAIQLSYSPVDEMAPALAPDGGALAFIRQVPSGRRSVWVLNLISGAEREIEAPDSVAAPTRLGWSADGAALYVETGGGGAWTTAAPPRAPAPRSVDASAPAADSALAVLLGSPPFGRITDCPGAAGPLCVVSPEGTTPLPSDARSAARWGADSLAYFAGDELVVRPLGPGRVRPVDVEGMPPDPRQLTAFGGLR